jgi:hypothetical protein
MHYTEILHRAVSEYPTWQATVSQTITTKICFFSPCKVNSCSRLLLCNAISARFKDNTEVVLHIQVFWAFMPCRLVRYITTSVPNDWQYVHVQSFLARPRSSCELAISQLTIVHHPNHPFINPSCHRLYRHNTAYTRVSWRSSYFALIRLCQHLSQNVDPLT